MQPVALFAIAVLFFSTTIAYSIPQPPIRFDEPDGCLEPPADYRQLSVNGQTLNQRTLAMLAQAQKLYGGPIDLTNRAITQGSYTGGTLALSFGTHDNGGAVDLSVRNMPESWAIRWDDIPLMLRALRTAGFAAWYRDEADGMSPHIHAIAIGDAELSYAAGLQLDGRYGYFRGFDGLPQPDGVPQEDQDGNPILCKWMVKAGYRDLRSTTEIHSPPYEYILGEAYMINMTWGYELNMRDAPGLHGTVISRLRSETPVTLVDGPQSANGFRWWLIELEDGSQGWAADSVNGVLTIVN